MSPRYEFDTRPENGAMQEISAGVQWLRMPLPFALAHINLWLIDDDNGWAIVDTGIATDLSKQTWRNALKQTQPQKPVSRVIVTHLHPDHVGCAGWLVEEHDVELWMTREEYLLCRVLVADTGRAAPKAGTRFYRAAGFPDDALNRYEEMFGMFGKFVAPLPDSFQRLRDGQTLTLADSEWEVIVGNGHSPEHACLFDARRNLLVSGDQLLPTISSNVSVYPTEPAANPLDDWLTSLKRLKSRIPPDVLVLPAHGKPFRGAHERLDALIEEHSDGLDKLLELCAHPVRAIDAFEALFKARISDSNLIMATGESVAHLNYLLHAGEIGAETGIDGVTWYQKT